MLTIEKVEESIILMDSKYEANFGEWIQNSVNCKTIGTHLRQYIQEYSLEDNVIVLKWIVRKWTLKSIVNLCTNLLVEKDENCNTKLSLKKIAVCQGIIFTWNTDFITEFVNAVAGNLSYSQSLMLRFYANIFSAFDDEKFKEILGYLKEMNIETAVIDLIMVRKSKSTFNTGVKTISGAT
ncbi:hypothetical protein CDIK_0583 [Cucumispora dikerogammari]|nr:hypothetical protein CDIK_0583 [Cucumispora dikerogammari]